MKEPFEIQSDVLAELRWEPSVDAGAIGVAVHDGVATLTGHVHSLAERRAAVAAAKRVAGVRAVADELSVRLPASAVRDDTDIAETIVRNLSWNSLLPSDRVKATVDNGWVTLDGEVEWKYQRAEAERAVALLKGVRGVTNLIHLRPRVTPTAIEEQIRNAFRRHADTDADQIFAETVGAEVTLRGRVRSLAEYQDAEWAAWSAPGVVRVENRLELMTPGPVCQP